MTSPRAVSLGIFRAPQGSAAEPAEKPRETPCDLCEGTSFELAGRRDRLGRELPTVLCRTCGLVSHLAIPSDEELLRYYQRQYRLDYHGQAAPAPHRVVRAWRSGALLVQRLAPLLVPGDSVFEIGAGIGCTIKQFELAGFAAAGIEPGAAYQAFSREKIKAAIGLGAWRDVPPGPRYNLVLMVHVIEHLNSPRAALAHVRKLLAPGGLLYVECPNLYSPHAAPSRLFHSAHVYNFTPATLALLCRRSGFEIECEYSQPRDRNLSFLLSRARRAAEILDGEGYQQAREALVRYNSLTYHLRPSYLQARLASAARNLSDRFLAHRRARQILDLCAASPNALPLATRRAA